MILDQARASRSGVRSYHLVVRSSLRLVSNSREPEKVETTTALYEVWRQGERVRTDYTTVESTWDTVGVGRRRILCRNCERRGYAISTSINPDSISPVQFYLIDDTFDKQDRFRINWAELGLLDGSLAEYQRKTPDATLLLFKTTPGVVAEPSSRGGRSTVRFHLPTARGGGMTCWLCPDLGMNPVRYEMVAPAAPASHETSIEYAKAKGTDIWFPTSVHYRRTIDGVVVLDQKLDVETAEINQPIPAEVFTFKGMGLPEGTPIEYPEIKRLEDQPTWDGEKVDPTRTRGQRSLEAYYHLINSEPPVPDTPEPGRRRPYYLGGGVLAVVGGVLVARAVRRRQLAGA
ncbi:MAG: hypothetical protein K2X87_11840 [Gemmataceae bacterium]|nr:hypothetical protein [Gemmataceae bacterium]